jgi:hypothetical protein
VNAAVDFAPQKPRGFEDAQVLRNRRERDVEGFRQFRDGGFALGQARQDGAARGIGECSKRGVERRALGGLIIVNHMV